MNNIQKYQNEIFFLLKKITSKQRKKFIEIAKEFYNTYKNDGMIYIFGTGHSHMLAEEGHFRAGGFAPICPILNSDLMLHKNTIVSSVLERQAGVASKLLKKYKIKPKDILVIFTNSGVNQAPLEAAYFAEKIKCKIAIENHFAFPSKRMANIIKLVDHNYLGACLDVANSICTPRLLPINSCHSSTTKAFKPFIFC